MSKKVADWTERYRHIWEARLDRLDSLRYPSLEVRDMVMSTGMAHGAGISYDRLEDLVAGLQRS